MRSTAEVLDHHLKCFAARDMEGVLADYSADAVFFGPEGALRGPNAIKPVFEKIFAELAKPGKSLVRFRRRVREITRRAKGVSIDATMEELVPYMRGWRSYFGFCETPRVLAYLTSWVRARLRVALWRQWKTPRRRRAALLELGVRPKLASNTAGSSRGPWYLAHAKALSVALPNAYFQSLGLPHLEDAS